MIGQLRDLQRIPVGSSRRKKAQIKCSGIREEFRNGRDHVIHSSIRSEDFASSATEEIPLFPAIRAGLHFAPHETSDCPDSARLFFCRLRGEATEYRFHLLR